MNSRASPKHADPPIKPGAFLDVRTDDGEERTYYVTAIDRYRGPMVSRVSENYASPAFPLTDLFKPPA